MGDLLLIATSFITEEARLTAERLVHDNAEISLRHLKFAWNVELRPSDEFEGDDVRPLHLTEETSEREDHHALVFGSARDCVK